MTGRGRFGGSPEDDDQLLIRRVLADDPGAETELLDRFRGLAIGLARGRFGFDPFVAHEIWQEVVVKLWADDRKALRAWRGEGRFSTYLTVIVVRLCLRHRRTRARREQASEPLESASQVPADDLGPQQTAARAERRRALAAALAGLSARDRLLLTLRFHDGHEPAEIARLLRLSAGAVRKALFDARKRLRRRLVADAPELFAPDAGNATARARSHRTGGRDE